jgi:hypothetical protein
MAMRLDPSLDGHHLAIRLERVRIRRATGSRAYPSFRGLISRLLSRANVLAEHYGSAVLYSSEEALSILRQCRLVAIASASTRGDAARIMSNSRIH